MPALIPARRLPSSEPENLSGDICTCDPICNCDKGIPTGAKLVSLLQWGIARNEAMLTIGIVDRKDMTALRTRTHRAKLLIQGQELRVAMRAEYGVS